MAQQRSPGPWAPSPHPPDSTATRPSSPTQSPLAYDYEPIEPLTPCRAARIVPLAGRHVSGEGDVSDVSGLILKDLVGPSKRLAATIAADGEVIMCSKWPTALAATLLLVVALRNSAPAETFVLSDVITRIALQATVIRDGKNLDVLWRRLELVFACTSYSKPERSNA
jgi:hypothetical protein